ncbi:tyrosine-type recombinase/integrase [Acidocella sp.]|uniref:tyrosine-type recombinase/integrase n=1 Tax=Acidocella sp. TaxID=50710 RepID=UPI0038D18490
MLSPRLAIPAALPRVSVLGSPLVALSRNPGLRPRPPSPPALTPPEAANGQPHVLRHTPATWMAQAGVSMWDIACFLGHAILEMVSQTYGHWSPEFLQNAARALGEAFVFT